jgi:hypothetical protein
MITSTGKLFVEDVTIQTKIFRNFFCRIYILKRNSLFTTATSYIGMHT